MSDNVKHPSHYAEGRKYEPKDVIRDWGLNFNLGNAVKYLSRAGRKADLIEDLKKAQQYIQFEIEAIETERAKPTADPARLAIKSGCRICAERNDCVDAYTEKSQYCGNYSRCKEPVTPNVGAIKVKIPLGTPVEQVIDRVFDELFKNK